MLTAAYAGFFAVCATAAVLVSATHRTSRAALTTLVGLWICLWVVMPRALPSIAGTLYPTPAKAEFDAALERDLHRTGDSHNPADPYFNRLREDLLAQNRVKDVNELPVNFGGVVMAEGERITARLHAEHHERLTETFRRQDRLSGWAAVVNPYLALRSVSMALAGTDPAHFRDFETRAEAHRYAFVQRLNHLHATEIRYKDDRAQRVTRDRWAEFPEFRYRTPGWSWALEREPLAMVALLLWLGMAGAALAWVSRRASAL
jgi:ABC-2 type transport system permease protein